MAEITQRLEEWPSEEGNQLLLPAETFDIIDEAYREIIRLRGLVRKAGDAFNCKLFDDERMALRSEMYLAVPEELDPRKVQES